MQTEDPIATDAALMARVADGDMAASRLLCGQYLDRAYTTACLFLGNSSNSDDVVQEAFLRLWKVAPKWEAKAQINTWLHRVIHNLCIDRLRKEKRYMDTEVPDIEDPTPDVVERHDLQQKKLILDNGIHQLPARQRIALTLVHFEDCTNIEAADKMDLSVDALESLLARGRRKLKEILAPYRKELDGDLT